MLQVTVFHLFLYPMRVSVPAETLVSCTPHLIETNLKKLGHELDFSWQALHKGERKEYVSNLSTDAEFQGCSKLAVYRL